MKAPIFLLFPLLIGYTARTQDLKPGFDLKEYQTLLAISSRQGDSSTRNPIPPPQHFRLSYRSAVVGLDNRWDLWTRDDGKLAVISIRGTTASPLSWLANFYCAAIPAKGSLQLNDSTTFHYQVADDPRAAVHVGWMIALGYLLPSIEAQIHKLNEVGCRQILIMGHSQGAAIAFLLRSALYYEQRSGHLPAGLAFKTYCSAAPKPGNLYYAYDYEYLTRGSWSFTVVNALDWVPETPFSIQQMQDINELNPFSDVSTLLRGQKWYVRLYLKHALHKLDKATSKAARRYRKFLGTRMFKLVHRYLPQLREPRYAATMNYMRTGTPIVLQPDEEYLKSFQARNPYGAFYHHTFQAYYQLAERGYGEAGSNEGNK